MEGLNTGILKECVIPLPALPEQKRIAALLEKADGLRRRRRYARQLSDTFLQSVFLEIFGDSSSDSKRWDWSSLGDLSFDLTYGTSIKCSAISSGMQILRIPNVVEGEINLADLKYGHLSAREAESLVLRKGDILFVRTNGNPDYVARSAVFSLPGAFGFASYLIRCRLNLEKVDPVFISSYLKTPSGRRALSKRIRTTAGQFNISAEGLRAVPAIVPPLSLQQKFANIVRRFGRLRAQQREAERQAEHLFQTLLHRAFSGES